MKKLALLIVPVLSIFASCGGSSQEEVYTKKPVDDFIRDFYNEENYSIILHDMDVDDSGWSNKYFHKYRIIREKDTMVAQIDTVAASDSNYVVNEDAPLVKSKIPYDSITGWMQVPDRYFKQQQDNMGMALVTKDENGVSKVASPPGYNNYVGNRRYGYWNGGFWHFYGQYMFMSSMFGMMSRPVYYSDYGRYRSTYYGRQPYYGRKTSSGSYSYGTNSSYNKKSNPSFFSRRQSKTGWSKSTSSSSSSKTSGTGSSKYSSGSSYRSSGGGFGK